MNQSSPEKTIEKITSIIHNQPLASAIYKSVASAQSCPFFYMNDGNSGWDIFKRSLDASIYDIEEHPKGKLFRRLIEYGPHLPGDPESLTSDGESTLSDPECGLCVQFIYSHMFNRFKGELAELLSIKPCLELVYQLQNEGQLPKGINLYWGDMVQARHQTRGISGEPNEKWGSFIKGPDGLIIEQISSHANPDKVLKIHGVIEVKSRSLSKKNVLAQIERHISRLNGGVKLSGVIWPPTQINFSKMIRIIVEPSTWKLNRDWISIKTDRGREIILSEPSKLPIQTRIEKLQSNFWRIQLAWSEELLNHTAYETTFWYWYQVGRSVYSGKSMPKGWEHLSPEEAGYNAIIMMLYYMPLRYISKRHQRLAIKLYNVYSFGYPLAAESREMLWPEDFPHEAGRDVDSWRDFQNKVAEIFRKSPIVREAYVEHTVIGSSIGKVKVDVLVEFSTGIFIGGKELVHKVIIECKFWKKRVPQAEIYKLKTIVEDVGAQYGILITDVGVQSGVKKYVSSPGNILAVTFKDLHTITKKMDVLQCTECGEIPHIVFTHKGWPTLCRECYRKEGFSR